MHEDEQLRQEAQASREVKEARRLVGCLETKLANMVRELQTAVQAAKDEKALIPIYSPREEVQATTRALEDARNKLLNAEMRWSNLG